MVKAGRQYMPSNQGGPSAPRRSSTRAIKTVLTTIFDVCAVSEVDMILQPRLDR
jgi:hypothetical protein